MIRDFFDQDIDGDYKNLLDKIRGVNSCSDGIQRKINRLDNLVAYKNHIADEEIKSEINQLLYQALPYSDISYDEAYNSFPSNYLSKVFELAIFKFLKVTQLLDLCCKRNSEPPDFLFMINSIQHQVECVTRTSSLMNEFYKIIPDFGKFKEVSKILKEENDIREGLYQSKFDNIFSEPVIAVLFRELSIEKTDKIQKIMGVSNKLLCEQIFIHWVYCIKYSYLFFTDCLSLEVINELENISLPRILCGNESHDKKTNDFILNGIVSAIVEKAKKSYFAAPDKPITLAISFSLSRNFLSVPDPTTIIGFICNKLRDEVNSKVDIQLGVNIFDNLYAIIIDTTWYNWFPEIAIKRHGAKFQTGFNNCYGCIYNSEHFLVKSEQLIYDRIPYIGRF
ncbi:TPA: hypothetical protein KKW48_003124 [Legionella pneumophila]|nr:hypothetical protein [Legionella pneumophila]